MDNYVGKTLNGCYEIQEIIGVGGMAVVYKAYDNMSQKTVAIKVMKDEFLADEDFRRRFKNESKAVALLSHPNIVKVYDVSFGDKLQYMVMEYIDGISLKEYIEQQGKLTYKETVHFTTQILKAMQHAHDKGIVHRDIKPQNIMLLHNGTIKVTDFGIARFSRSETKTMTGKAIGSVHYISPEQARGETTDERADIYSVGVMLYEMLTGQVPFQSDNAVSVAIMQLQADAKKPTELNPDIPPALEEITMKAMKKNPAERYSSASEMLADFKMFKENPNVRFNYDYFADNQPTRHIDVNEVKAGLNKKENGSENKIVTRQMKSKLKLLKYIAIACVTVCIVLLIVFIATASGGNKYECPDLVGQTYEEVEGSYGDFFGNIVIEEKYDNTHPIGTVIGQSISVGEKIKEGTNITVTISKGTAGDETRVPNLAGKTLEEATELINIADLVIKVVREDNKLYAPGTVIRAEPGYNTLVYKKSVVTVYVNEEQGNTKTNKVPNVKFQTYEDAVRALEIAGLEVGEVTESNSNYPKGMVITQAIKGDTMVEKGAKIDLVISNGVKVPVMEITLPKFPTRVEGDIVVYCNSQRQDDMTLKGMLLAGNKITIDLTNVSNTIDPEAGPYRYEVHVVSSRIDKVIFVCDVDFKTGEMENAASYVYSYIPDVTGRGIQEARDLLESYGFTVEVERVTIEGAAAPIVSAQYPESSDEVYLTSDVTVRLTVVYGEDYLSSLS
ncbi:MAG: Stk1 family PASTA domain-containing Ser/Thr kinase [Clostridia bacterium]|nr:Stk1 family PASTA domain-containing Ser/Thr kinase [Clostridia bacterium]